MSWSNEAEAREQIKELVAQYYHDFKEKKEPFKEGDRISYASRVFDEKEMQALTDATLDFWLTTGRFSDQFEKEFASWIGVKFAHLVNSGSSANLIAFMTLTAPELGDRQIKPGDEVITVACGFPTTVTPVLNYGAIPVFVDVTVPQYNIDVTKLEGALSDKTKAVMIAHTLGNPFDLKAVREFCKKHNLWLVEDNCDALGTKYTIDGETKFSGTWGDIGTSSFYPPHHMTMGELFILMIPYSTDLSFLIVTGVEIVFVPAAEIISADIVLTVGMVNFPPVMIISMYTATSVLTLR